MSGSSFPAHSCGGLRTVNRLAMRDPDLTLIKHDGRLVRLTSATAQEQRFAITAPSAGTPAATSIADGRPEGVPGVGGRADVPGAVPIVVAARRAAPPDKVATGALLPVWTAPTGAAARAMYGMHVGEEGRGGSQSLWLSTVLRKACPVLYISAGRQCAAATCSTVALHHFRSALSPANDPTDKMQR
jgi:hypothetical protein